MMKGTFPSNKVIAEAFARVRPELVKRYGRSENCSLGQVKRTVEDLTIPQEVFPYVFAEFLSEADSQEIAKEFPGTNWEEVLNRSGRIVSGSVRTSSGGASFYESHEGFPDE